MVVGHKFYSQGWSNAPLLPCPKMDLRGSLSALFRLLMVACHPFIFIHYVLVLPNLSAIVKDSCGKTLVELANPVAPENLRSEGGILI